MEVSDYLQLAHTQVEAQVQPIRSAIIVERKLTHKRTWRAALQQ